MPRDTAATTAALRRATHLRVFGGGSSVIDRISCAVRASNALPSSFRHPGDYDYERPRDDADREYGETHQTVLRNVRSDNDFAVARIQTSPTDVVFRQPIISHAVCARRNRLPQSRTPAGR